MKQCHWKGAKFDGLKLKLKTEDLRISLTQERLRWALGIRKLLFGGTSSKSLQRVPYAPVINTFKLPMTNCQSNLC